ncbi:MAG TPA: aminotransferase class V-fold PLP-dependent enzyme [Gemmatimonadaceae bacterium]|nr:aminotransferase class V-fold PLP-dependent enzyme [Gemmatimonadaceae bacterium]
MLISPALGVGFETLREREFSRLDRNRLAYLDYTGSALYGDSQLRSHHALLADGVFGNPHSENGPSAASSRFLEMARTHVLRFLDADPDRYAVVFTANSSAAIKLVAESYPFRPGAALVLSSDNHNSINGIREYAKRACASVTYVPLDDELRLDAPEHHLAAISHTSAGPKLFAYPAQSNFSGVQHSISLISEAQRLGFDVLLDAAAFAPSNRLSLREHSPQFVALSFYKIFGYPTGIGALVVRRDALHRLHRPWFAGGTVEFASVLHDMHRLKGFAEAFEDGTPDFLSVAALPAGFALIDEIGIDRAHDHVMRLTALLLEGLSSFVRSDGRPLVRLYGPTNLRARGGTVAFNIVSHDGSPVPYAFVESRARDDGIAVRGGCFCNPGAAERAFGFDAKRSGDCMRTAARAGFTVERFAACLDNQTAVGAVRASLGVANNAGDVSRALELIASFAD